MDESHKNTDDNVEVIGALPEESQIRKFYAGKTVFLTGSTGFMGKVLVEKLLRGCPDLKCLYVMIRPKKGQSVEERMKKFFDNELYAPLREMYPDFESKVHAMEGDLGKEDLGLSEKDKNTIIEETNIIFHNASNVKFTERISSTARINVLGTASTLDLAMKCKKVEGFLYVSTAYSHCYRFDIKEEAYPPPADLNQIKNLIAADEATSTGFSKKELDRILGKYPNTYVYTKAAAEGVVADVAKQAPFACIIYRPSIVLSTWQEPIKAWLDNYNGPVMLFVAYGMGLMHVMYRCDKISDYVPVDMSINSIMMSMWDVVINRPNNSTVFVYNYGSSTVKPISMEGFRKLCLSSGRYESLNYSIKTAWRIFKVETNCDWYFGLLHIVFHFIPALFVDAYLLSTGKKAMAASAVMKASYGLSIFKYFAEKEWMIDITETSKAIARMNSVDRKLFFCDFDEFNWEDYMVHYWNGLRVYIIKDPMSTLPAAIKRYDRLTYLHNTIVFTLISLVVYFILTVLGLL